VRPAWIVGSPAVGLCPTYWFGSDPGAPRLAGRADDNDVMTAMMETMTNVMMTTMTRRGN
jgi:hypothetical protein